MCFSSQASFASGVALMVIGIASVSKATNKSQYLLASVPILFSVQQFTEGMLWLSLQHTDYAHWKSAATFGFLLFAQAIWPAMVPLLMFTLERDKKRRKILAALSVFGFCVGLYLFYCLFTYPVQAGIENHHIRYDLSFPLANTVINAVLYLTPILAPPFISGNKHMRALGMVLILSLVATAVFYEQYLISVWCFFAAIMSMMILYIIVRLNKKRPQVILQSS